MYKPRTWCVAGRGVSCVKRYHLRHSRFLLFRFSISGALSTKAQRRQQNEPVMVCCNGCDRKRRPCPWRKQACIAAALLKHSAPWQKNMDGVASAGPIIVFDFTVYSKVSLPEFRAPARNTSGWRPMPPWPSLSEPFVSLWHWNINTSPPCGGEFSSTGSRHRLL